MEIITLTLSSSDFLFFKYKYLKIFNSLEFKVINIRNFGIDYNCSVFDKSYGCCVGVILLFEVLLNSILVAKKFLKDKKKKIKIILLSPQGIRIIQKYIYFILNNYFVIFISNKYRGIDNRILDYYIDEEWSVGDYILSSGNLFIMTIIDSYIRFLPDFFNNINSIKSDSFFNNLLDVYVYSKPKKILENIIPSVLLSGNHAKINIWMLKMRLFNTYNKRWDLLIY